MIALIINTYYTGKLIQVGYLKQMSDLLPTFLVSLGMWGIIHISSYLSANVYLQLIIGVSLGILSYLLGAKILLKNEWNDAIDMIPSKFKHNFLN